MHKLLSFFFSVLLTMAVCPLSSAQKPAVPTPTRAQLAWHETEFYLFFHFGPNTFTNLEWGHGTETEALFNPTDLDCDQWCRVAKLAGAKGVVVTAKHHDGFCLWPSKYSTHTVRESKWRNGKGDVLQELSDACRRYDLKFGVYLSPWDRNHPLYGTPEYNDVYANTLTELLTGYGELFEVWWDGANGEGPNGKKQEYDFPRFEKIVKKYQPNAIIFSDIGPGCRWAGNESGTVNETNWCMLDTVGFGRGATGPPGPILQTGQENGAAWIPAECDVSIRPGWFYHAEEDQKVKTPEALFDIYLQSVGRGANLILNVPPDRRGRIHERDSSHLAAFGATVQRDFANNLAFDKNASIANGSRSKTTRALTDGNQTSAYHIKTTKNHQEGAVTVDLGEATVFNCVKLCEDSRYFGQNVKDFKVEIWDDKGWQRVAHSTTIGARKILVFPRVRASKLRITILKSKNKVRLSEVQVFNIKQQTMGTE
jgi:alpha-L-fucosidase